MKSPLFDLNFFFNSHVLVNFLYLHLILILSKLNVEIALTDDLVKFAAAADIN